MTIEKTLHRSGAFSDFFAQGVQVGNALYLAGQVGTDADGNTPDSITEQVAIAYSNIASVLAAFDATMDNIVDETWFVTDIPELMSAAGAIFAAREQTFGRKPEVAQTLVQVAALVSSDMKVEIKCIAHL